LAEPLLPAQVGQLGPDVAERPTALDVLPQCLVATFGSRFSHGALRACSPNPDQRQVCHVTRKAGPVGGALLDVGPLVQALVLGGGVALGPGTDQPALVDDLDHTGLAAHQHGLASLLTAGVVVAAGERDLPAMVDLAADDPGFAGEVTQRSGAQGLVERDGAVAAGGRPGSSGLVGSWRRGRARTTSPWCRTCTITPRQRSRTCWPARARPTL
jgi:hypothetical protein